jgi:uncharacterized membrane protein YjfL (UPF0719 family)
MALNTYIYALGNVIAMGIILAFGAVLMVWVINRLTLELHIWQELKEKNVAVGIIVAALILALALLAK